MLCCTDLRRHLMVAKETNNIGFFLSQLHQMKIDVNIGMSNYDFMIESLDE